MMSAEEYKRIYLSYSAEMVSVPSTALYLRLSVVSIIHSDIKICYCVTVLMSG